VAPIVLIKGKQEDKINREKMYEWQEKAERRRFDAVQNRGRSHEPRKVKVSLPLNLGKASNGFTKNL
jgi:hypothetical protein